MEAYFDTKKIIDHYEERCWNKDKLQLYKNCLHPLQQKNFNTKHFIKTRGDDELFVKVNWKFYNFDDKQFKEYISNPDNIEQFKTMCLVNIFNSRVIKIKKKSEFIENEFPNLFKDFASKYIEIEMGKLNPENDDIIKFNRAYQLAYHQSPGYNTDKGYVKKSRLKKAYLQYVECGDVEKCSSYKEQLYLLVALINTLC
jgi:hypothetical protein